MDEVNITCYVNKLPIRFLLSRNSQSSIMKILHNQLALYCLSPAILLLFLIPDWILGEESCHCLNLFSSHSYSSASNCFWLRSLVAKITQLPLTCFSSITCLHHWTWTISTFIILPSTAALFLIIITTYFYCTSYTLEFFWAQATLSFWSHPASCSPIHTTLHYGW